MEHYINPIPRGFIFNVDTFYKELAAIFKDFKSLVEGKIKCTNFIESCTVEYYIEIFNILKLPQINYCMRFNREFLMDEISKIVSPRKVSVRHSGTMLICISVAPDVVCTVQTQLDEAGADVNQKPEVKHVKAFPV